MLGILYDIDTKNVESIRRSLHTLKALALPNSVETSNTNPTPMYIYPTALPKNRQSEDDTNIPGRKCCFVF